MGCCESSEKAKGLLNLFKENEKNLSKMKEKWPSGCVYSKWVEEESRLGPNGLTEIRTRTCRKVTGCNDPDYNQDTICEGWSDWI
jgi:hypothetical protein